MDYIEQQEGRAAEIEIKKSVAPRERVSVLRFTSVTKVCSKGRVAAKVMDWSEGITKLMPSGRKSVLEFPP